MSLSNTQLCPLCHCVYQHVRLAEANQSDWPLKRSNLDDHLIWYPAPHGWCGRNLNRSGQCFLGQSSLWPIENIKTITTYLSICLTVYFSLCLSVCLSVCRFVHPSVCLYYMFLYYCIYIYMYMYVHKLYMRIRSEIRHCIYMYAANMHIFVHTHTRRYACVAW